MATPSSSVPGTGAIGGAFHRIPNVAWLILGLALAVRLGAIAVVDFTLVGDPQAYDEHARSIAEGNGYPESKYAPGGGPSAFRPPLYPYLLGALYAVTGPSLTAGQVAAALAGVLSVGLLGVLARQLWTRREGLVAMGIAAVYPPLVLTNTTLISESLALPLMLGTLVAALHFRRTLAIRWAVLAGALLSLAILDRPALIVLVPPLLVGLWVPPRRRAGSVIPAVVALVAAVVLILPWTVRNALEMDAFVPLTTQTGYLLAGTYNDAARLDERLPGLHRSADLPQLPEYRRLFERSQLEENALSSLLEARARDYISEHPGYVTEVIWWNSLRLFDVGGGKDVGRLAYSFQGIGHRPADIGRFSFYALALVAFVGLVVGAVRRNHLFLWAMPVILWLSVVVISGDVRYRLPIDPFVILLAAFGLGAAHDRLGHRRRRAV